MGVTVFDFTVVQVDAALAERAATVLHGELRGLADVTLATFDAKVLAAHAALHPDG